MFFFFFFNDTATTEIYTLSLHDALPICRESFANAIAVRSEVDGSPALPMSLHAGHGLCASRLARDWYHIGRRCLDSLRVRVQLGRDEFQTPAESACAGQLSAFGRLVDPGD